MKKRYIATAIGMAGVGLVTNYLLRNKKDESYTLQKHILDEAGIPDQIEDDYLSQLENANMVSEGSQYGVSYYNEVKASEESTHKQ